MSNHTQDDRPRAVKNGMSQEEYDTWMWLSEKDFEAGDKPYTFIIPQSEITKFLKVRNQYTQRLVLEGKIEALARVENRGLSLEGDYTEKDVLAHKLLVINQDLGEYQAQLDKLNGDRES